MFRQHSMLPKAAQTLRLGGCDVDGGWGEKGVGFWVWCGVGWSGGGRSQHIGLTAWVVFEFCVCVRVRGV